MSSTPAKLAQRLATVAKVGILLLVLLGGLAMSPIDQFDAVRSRQNWDQMVAHYHLHPPPPNQARRNLYTYAPTLHLVDYLAGEWDLVLIEPTGGGFCISYARIDAAHYLMGCGRTLESAAQDFLKEQQGQLSTKDQQRHLEDMYASPVTSENSAR